MTEINQRIVHHTTPHHNRSKISPNISFGGASVFTVVTTSTLLLLCWILVWRDILLLLSHFYLGINSANTAFQFCTHTNWRPGNEKNSKQLLKIFPHAMVVVATAQSEPRDVIHWEQDLAACLALSPTSLYPHQPITPPPPSLQQGYCLLSDSRGLRN